MKKLEKPLINLFITIIFFSLIEIPFVFEERLFGFDFFSESYSIVGFFICNISIIITFVLFKYREINLIKVLIRICQWSFVMVQLYFVIKKPWIMSDKRIWKGSVEKIAIMNYWVSFPFHINLFCYSLLSVMNRTLKHESLFNILPVLLSIIIIILLAVFVKKPGFIG